MIPHVLIAHLVREVDDIRVDVISNRLAHRLTLAIESAIAASSESPLFLLTRAHRELIYAFFDQYLHFEAHLQARN